MFVNPVAVTGTATAVVPGMALVIIAADVTGASAADARIVRNKDKNISRRQVFLMDCQVLGKYHGIFLPGRTLLYHLLIASFRVVDEIFSGLITDRTAV